MREIRFRAWGKKNYDDKRKTMSSPFDIGKVCNECGWWVAGVGWDIGESIILQFTGLKDAKGVEIFEGDIMRVVEEQYTHLDKQFVIEWNKEMTGFNPLRNHTYLANHCEVIGNIWENGELLK